MNSSYPSAQDIEAILNASMQPVRSNCRIEADRTLTVQLTYHNEDFTMVGIGKDQYRDAQALRKLGRNLLEEIEAAIIMGAMRGGGSPPLKAQAI